MNSEYQDPPSRPSGMGKLEIDNWLLCLMGHSLFKGMRFSRVRVGFGFSEELDVAVAGYPLHLVQTMYFS